MQRNPKNQLRARSNLSYLQFVRLIARMWNDLHKLEDGTPTIEMFPAGNGDPAHYPCITYGLDLRRAHPSEPKPRLREHIDDENGDAYVTTGQRFQNVVKFTVYAEADPDLANEVIEEFEDFMLEYTPAFKELGASELVYGRRFSDSEENRSGAGVVKRAVAYTMTAEKVRATKFDRIDSIIIDARLYLEDNSRKVGARNHSGKPKFYLQDNRSYLEFFVEEVPNGTVPENDFLTVRIPYSNFSPGDILHLNDFGSTTDMPIGMNNGLYEIVVRLEEEPYTSDTKYSMIPKSGSIEVTSTGKGIAFYMPGSVQINIHDHGG